MIRILLLGYLLSTGLTVPYGQDDDKFSQKLDRIRRSLNKFPVQNQLHINYPRQYLISHEVQTNEEPRGFCTKNGWKCGRYGNCVEQKDTYLCDCGYGMIGHDCQRPFQNPCLSPRSAQYVSSTHRFGTSPDTFLQCTGNGEFIAIKCPRGYDFDESSESCMPRQNSNGVLSCEHNPCENNGTCLDAGRTYLCACPPGYKGLNCEIRGDPCYNEPCGRGKCHSWADDYICECPNKVFDKCCCNGVRNLCSDGQQYYAHNATSFVHCGAGNNAYLKSCAPGLVWDQNLVTCTRPFESTQQSESSFDGQTKDETSYESEIKIDPEVLGSLKHFLELNEAITQPTGAKFNIKEHLEPMVVQSNTPTSTYNNFQDTRPTRQLYQFDTESDSVYNAQSTLSEILRNRGEQKRRGLNEYNQRQVIQQPLYDYDWLSNQPFPRA
ncbi:hypothetical protein ACOME3_001736 [Neoechinorhynchus agilis]